MSPATRERTVPARAGGEPIFPPMLASVLIPTFARSDKLSRCLECLASQTMDPANFEVIVGFDGPDAAAESSARETWTRAGGKSVIELMQCPREGLQLVRNRMLARARGRYMISINDDIRPVPNFVLAHVAAHEKRDGANPAVVVGSSPFCRRENESLLDRLTRKTSMIFFYDVMDAAAPDPGRDWGYRHCFGLNFSARVDLVREVGGFHAGERLYGYEDIELGYKLAQRFKTPILYRPDARAEHEHFYQPQDLIRREQNLGVAAWHFAKANPAFAHACFGRDITHPDEIAYSRAFVSHECGVAERLRESFLELGKIPASVVDGPHEPILLKLHLQQFVLLKRWTWHNAFLQAADASPAALAA